MLAPIDILIACTFQNKRGLNGLKRCVQTGRWAESEGAGNRNPITAYPNEELFHCVIEARKAGHFLPEQAIRPCAGRALRELLALH